MTELGGKPWGDTGTLENIDTEGGSHFVTHPTTVSVAACIVIETVSLLLLESVSISFGAGLQRKSKISGSVALHVTEEYTLPDHFRCNCLNSRKCITSNLQTNHILPLR